MARPYIYGWHLDIKAGRCGGKDVPVCLAGGVEKIGVVTNTGEVMIPRERGEVQGWILPMVRIVEELGGAVTWDVEEFKIVFPEGRVVKAKSRSDGLRYVNKTDLKWIRGALMRSHFQNRPLAARTKVSKLTTSPTGEDELEMIATQEITEALEEVQSWRNWENQTPTTDKAWIKKISL